jgi:hypothetical protein
MAGNRHQSRQTLDNLIDARALGVWTGLAKARNTREDDPRVVAPQRIVVYAEAPFYVRTEILDNDVGDAHEFAEQLAPERVLQIDGQAALVAVQVLIVGAVSIAGD